MPIIAVVGSRQSGKTTTVEAIVRGLTKKGYKVATAKHIPEVNFTIDTKDKDTWRHAQAGSTTVMGVAPNEWAIIRKVNITELHLDDLIQQCGKKVEILILEGFRELVATDPSIPKVVTIKTVQEVSEATVYFTPILAFEAPSKLKVTHPQIPTIDVLEEPEKLVEIVSKQVAPVVKRRRKHFSQYNSKD